MSVQQVGISLGLGLGLSRPLAVVAETVSVVAETVSVMAETVSVVAVSTVQQVGVSSSLGLGFRLGGADGRQGENYEQLHPECRMIQAKLCLTSAAVGLYTRRRVPAHRAR